nr:MAG TPA: Protein of unknown function (DUF3139) [Caudoviricetes sp.]
MNIIFSSLIVILFILLFTIFAAWIDKFGEKRKEEFIEKAIDKVSSLLTSKIALVMDQHKTGPWYLVVYTKDSNYPIWISNNNICSVHPDPKNRKIIIKQFNGEDMVIDNVENYELCSANEMCDYDM